MIALRSAFLTLVLAAPALAQDVAVPADDAEETVGIHTVQRGDTLWDLAGKFLGNPLSWPRIFELNQAIIEDPHWIYPGERLRVPGGVTQIDAMRVERAEDYLRNVDGEVGRYPEGSIFRQPQGGGSGLSGLAIDDGPPTPAVTAGDFRRAPLLVDRGELGAHGQTVRVLEENPLDLNLPSGIRQYVDVIIALGGLDPAIGDTLKAVRYIRTEVGYGEVALPLALVEVNRRWADSARATVVRMFADYEVGDAIVALERYDLDPQARASAEVAGLEARVIAFEVPQVLVGIGEAIFLDAGAEDGVAVGDEFGVFSRTEREAIVRDSADALTIVRVVHVAARTSTARVVHVSDPGTRPGDPVRRLRAMAGAPSGQGD